MNGHLLWILRRMLIAVAGFSLATCQSSQLKGGNSVAPNDGCASLPDCPDPPLPPKGEPICPTKEDPKRICSYPKYNTVFQTSTHNAYWKNIYTTGEKTGDWGAAGPHASMMDQLLHGHVRSMEWDIHYDGDTYGEFTVYHTSEPKNSQCLHLQDCLRIIRRFHYLVPDHEPIYLQIEFKEVSFSSKTTVFDARHSPDDLDAIFREELGDMLFTPMDFYRYCGKPKATGTLRQCMEDARGWPTINQLRGRVIVGVMGAHWDIIGIPSAVNELSLARYALGTDYVNGDVAASDYKFNVGRVGFPVRNVWGTHIDEAWYETESAKNNKCKAGSGDPYDWLWCKMVAVLNQNSIIWQVEAYDAKDIPNFMARGGLVRSPAAHLIKMSDKDFEDLFLSKKYNHPDDIGNVVQRLVFERGFQILMTDYLTHLGQDTQADGARLRDWSKIPSSVDRPFFQRADVFPKDPGTEVHAESELTEPGARLYLDSSSRLEAIDQGPWTFDRKDRAAHLLPLPPGDPSRLRHQAFAYKILPPGGNGQTDIWEVAPSTDNGTHDDGPYALYDGGPGCFQAQLDTSESPKSYFRICRRIDDIRQKDVIVSVEWADGIKSGKDEYRITTDDNEIFKTYRGEMFKIQLDRITSKTTIRVLAAMDVYQNNQPRWTTLPIASTYTFDTDLKVQGLKQFESGVFTHTIHNGKILVAKDFDLVFGTLDDRSFCLDGSCRGAGTIPIPEVVSHSSSGASYVAVHNARLGVFGKPMSVYSTNDNLRFVPAISHTNNIFLVRKYDYPMGVPSPLKPWYLCVSSRIEEHDQWLSMDPNCGIVPLLKSPAKKIFGYIFDPAKTPPKGAVPVFHFLVYNTGAPRPASHHVYVTPGPELTALLANPDATAMCDGPFGIFSCPRTPGPIAFVYPNAAALP